MTDADFLSITLNGKLCDREGGLGEHEFELVMREQVAIPIDIALQAGSCSRLSTLSHSLSFSMSSSLSLSLSPSLSDPTLPFFVRPPSPPALLPFSLIPIQGRFSGDAPLA